jgi:hypothetical protein
MSAMGLTGTDDLTCLIKKFSSPEMDYSESWEMELSIFIQKHPELSHSVTI